VYLARILQYAETPPYLRRSLLPQHADLQFAGLLPTLDAPHHVRQLDRCSFREGVTLDKPPGTRPGGSGKTGSFVDVGLKSLPVSGDDADRGSMFSHCRLLPL